MRRKTDKSQRRIATLEELAEASGLPVDNIVAALLSERLELVALSALAPLQHDVAGELGEEVREFCSMHQAEHDWQLRQLAELVFGTVARVERQLRAGYLSPAMLRSAVKADGQLQSVMSEALVSLPVRTDTPERLKSEPFDPVLEELAVEIGTTLAELRRWAERRAVPLCRQPGVRVSCCGHEAPLAQELLELVGTGVRPGWEGSSRELAAALGVPIREVKRWMAGEPAPARWWAVWEWVSCGGA